ncbi:MAG: methylenetetrahydrofolate reductase [Steroidobacteraceae bacterium]
MNSLMVPPLTGDELKRSIIEFVRGASTEISTHDEELLPAIANKLPAGTTLYVAHPPKASLEDVIRVALKVEAAGLRACAHIVARRLESERALKNALRELREGGVEQVLLVGGDPERPIGSLTGTLDVLNTGYLTEAGFKRIGVAGHPEGHKAIGPTVLWQSLRHKQDYAERTGIKAHIVSQFGFNPAAVCTWDQHLGEHGIKLPVHVGIAGPTSLPKLIRFAMQCGVGASLHALMKNMSAMSNPTRLAISPDEMVVSIIQGRSAYSGTHIVQPHFYSFGGAVATARWLAAVSDGNFELSPGGGKFVMNS